MPKVWFRFRNLILLSGCYALLIHKSQQMAVSCWRWEIPLPWACLFLWSDPVFHCFTLPSSTLYTWLTAELWGGGWGGWGGGGGVENTSTGDLNKATRNTLFEGLQLPLFWNVVAHWRINYVGLQFTSTYLVVDREVESKPRASSTLD